MAMKRVRVEGDGVTDETGDIPERCSANGDEGAVKCTNTNPLHKGNHKARNGVEWFNERDFG